MKIMFFIIGVLVATTAYAVCPMCTFAVGAGIGLAQYFGIDDVITGIWIGGMLISLIVMTINWLMKKKVSSYGVVILVALFYYGAAIIPLYLSGIIGHELNKFLGYDKLLFGIVMGSILFFLSHLSYKWMKRHNSDKPYFPYQKIVMSLMSLFILSIIFYFLTK